MDGGAGEGAGGDKGGVEVGGGMVDGGDRGECGCGKDCAVEERGDRCMLRAGKEIIVDQSEVGGGECGRAEWFCWHIVM